ncbi:chemotaxis protein CheD [Desulfopila aestuarii]|uniref:Probable chemoreceptor glutamine deamidase CheD n=1 Tax=Desulfopila aestuarii DSM 18488 TaxID=1121416 RepID=A0A1M7XX56_9BACT|nr:chemotaxis protein CheD [Desulfopila aestuarii]SHO43445.1 chemotaxis protein CheD [Desulfopila aestuarii DSM 18488]
MNMNHSPLEKIYLKPGELVITQEPVMVTTVLGSCVSVTMYHSGSKTASICHGMLPKGGGSDNFKFVDTSIGYMIKFFQKMKIAREEIEVKLFGGADMFSGGRVSVSNLTVGRQNITTAIRCLKGFGLTIAASDVGGKNGRKLIFRTDSGIVFIKKMSGQDQLPIT